MEKLDGHFPACTSGKPFVSGVNSERLLNMHDQVGYLHNVKQKPFIRKLCDKRFTQRNNLNVHLHIHSKEKHLFARHLIKDFLWWEI